MTCTTCGRENAPHLTFCQECGQRLGPRIAPPTPPIGLGGQDAYGPPPNIATANPAQDVRDLARRPVPANGAMSSPEAPAATAASGDRRCKICDTMNGPNLRYCTSCGSTLDAAPAPAAVAPVANAVQAARVVDLGGRPPTADAVRTCNRCRGVAETAAQFCKFCGASLSDAAPAATVSPNASNERAERTNGSPADEGRSGAPSPRGPTAPIAQVNLQVMQSMGRPAAAASHSPAAPVSAALAPAVPAAPAVAHAPSYGPSAQASGAAALAAISRPSSIPPAPSPSRAPIASPSTQRGRLVVIAKSGADGPSYPFGDLLDIGRVEGNVIVGEDPYLSPRHVRILWNNGKLVLRDLASTNGVYLRLSASRDKITPRATDTQEIAVPLVDQDFILVGQQVLRFDVLKEAEAGLGPAQEHGTLLFGSPAAPRYARLCQRTVEGIARDIYYVRKVETVLGRESGDVVFTEDPFLSRRHAAIRLLSRDGSPPAASSSKPPPGEARFALVDLGSSNGTFLRIRADVELAPGDHFRVGQQLFRVDFDAHQGARGA